jgi:hypothetical protein
MSERTQAILNNYFLQKQAGLGSVLRGIGGAVKRGAKVTGRGAKKVLTSPERAANKLGDKLINKPMNEYNASQGGDITPLASKRYKIGAFIKEHPKAVGYGAAGTGLALLGGGAAATGAALSGDDSIVGQGLGLAKDNPLAAAGIGAGAGALTAGSIAYALAPEKAKKLAALIAGAAGAAAAGAGTYYGLKNA